MQRTNARELCYRPEIDGLRAVSILFVLLYHAQFLVFGRDWFEGGYIGVDIFFVLSGYLISRIILSEIFEKGTLNFLYFYERRVRRILPLLYAVVLATIPVAWQRLLPSDLVEYSKSLLFTLCFGSNIFFYQTSTEYGGDDALLKPMLHTWSLSVEEQFYIFFPILLLIACRFCRKYLLYVILILSLFSLVMSEMMQGQSPELNFYLPITRIWELAAGAMLANQLHIQDSKL